jgi:HK97 family phage portal protein
MSVIDRLANLFIPEPSEFQLQTRALASFEFTPLGEAVKAFRGSHTGSHRLASIEQALGVPAIQRAVSLISNTTGSLSVEGLRAGVPMDEPPRIVQRPDPFQTPREFYRDTAFCLATRGEAIWWIAARDTDGLPASLIVVPLHELTIEKNERDRRFPIYRWGKTVSTRFTPIANQTGEFVHLSYMKKPGDLRGKGPLQYCGVAISVTVEAQQWAANFFSGDTSTVELQSLVDLDPEEASRLRDQWMERGEAGLPRVTPPTLNWKEHQIDPESAQMVEARSHQDGEAARMFGIPGNLLEYASPGSSLTYQNVAEVFTGFVRSCLSINYLEPIEQAMTDLLPRTTVARFNVEGLLRADIKTRFEVYEKAVKVFGLEDGGNYARVREGLSPGNIETQPVPYAFPAAVPASLPETREQEIASLQARSGEVFANAMMMMATREQPAPVVNVHPSPITVESPAAPNVTFERGAFQFDAPEINVNTPDVKVDVAAPDMSGTNEAMAALADRPQTPTTVTVTTPPMKVDESLTEAIDELRARIDKPRNRRIERDENGRIIGMVEE